MTTSTPQAVLPVMDYATPGAGLGAECLSAARWMTGVAVMSGVCVGVCFLTLSSNGKAWWVHLGVFGVTIWMAVMAGVWLGRAGRFDRVRLMMDALAGVGLVMIGLAPVVWVLQEYLLDLDELWAVGLGVGYSLMAVTTYRHVLLYRVLGEWAGSAGRPGLRKSLIGLGYVKMVYEGLWLGCCAVMLLGIYSKSDGDFLIPVALAALFGCGGFGVIWIWMMIAHSMLVGAVKGRNG